MPNAAEIQEVLPGCYTWQSFCPSAKVDLTSHLLTVGNISYLVDPIRLGKAGLAQLDQLPAKISAVLLTNGNHARDAVFYRDRYSIPIHAAHLASAEFSFATLDFPEDLDGLEIIPLPGAGLGEVGIYDSDKKLLCLGDIVINLDSFAFAPLPDKYATDARQMRKSIQKLTTLEVRIICFAHGFPVLAGAAERLLALT